MLGNSIVTVPPESAWLTTLADAKDELQISGSANDIRLSKLIARATSAIERHCRRPFGLQTVVDTFRSRNVRQALAPYGTPLDPRAAVRDEIGITDTSLDVRLGSLIDRASSIIAKHCGISFGAQSVTENVRISPCAPRSVGPNRTAAIRSQPGGGQIVAAERPRPIRLRAETVSGRLGSGAGRQNDRARRVARRCVDVSVGVAKPERLGPA